MSTTPRASACRPRRLSVWTWALLLASLVFGGAIGRGEGQQGAETNALEALDRYLEGWNSRHPASFAATLSYPHTRQAPNSTASGLWRSAEEYAAGIDYPRVIATGWDHTQWDAKEVVHASGTKVHVAGRWSRVDADDSTIRTAQVTYVVTDVDGRWGVHARFAAGPPVSEADGRRSRQAAIRVVEAYMDAVNERDPHAFAATLNYPHYRVAGGSIQVWEHSEVLAETMSFKGLARTGWHRSEWDSVTPIQVSRNGVNVALELSRYDADGAKIASFHTLYLVTRQDDRWGIKARSSFAP